MRKARLQAMPNSRENSLGACRRTLMACADKGSVTASLLLRRMADAITSAGADGALRRQLLEAHRGGPAYGGETRPHQAGLDGSHVDVVGRKLVAKTLGEGGDGELGAPVHGVARSREFPEHAGDENEVPRTPRHHCGKEGAGHVDHPGQVGADNGCELGRVGLRQRPPGAAPRVVDEYVDMAELGRYPFLHLLHLLPASDVADALERLRSPGLHNLPGETAEPAPPAWRRQRGALPPGRAEGTGASRFPSSPR